MGVPVFTLPVARPRWRGGHTPGRAVCSASVNRSYVSRRSLRVALPEDAVFTSPAFLADTDRVVFLAFPDKGRRQRVGPDAWQVHLLPFNVLWWTIGAQCTLRIEAVELPPLAGRSSSPGGSCASAACLRSYTALGRA